MRVIVHTADPDPALVLLREAHPDVSFSGCNSYDGLAPAIAAEHPDVVYAMRFAGSTNYPRDPLFADNGPRWVSVGGSGIDHLGTWDTARVTVTNAAGVAAGMMAEYIIGGFLHFTLNVPGLLSDQAARHWDSSRLVRPLAGATLLIAGLGQTGQALAARAKAFGMQVIATRARPQPSDNVDEVHASHDIAALWGRADFIAICTPLLPQTRNMVDAAAFAAMKPGAILADVSRGGVVDQAALRQALDDGHLAAAVLDVFETEPLPAASPLWAEPNVLISPHCSSVFDGWEMASVRMFSENLARWQAGQPLNNVVDPHRGY